MGEHKGALTLIVVVVVLFGLFVAFGQNIVGPLLDTIGDKFTSMVDSVFTSTNVTDPNTIVTK